MQSLKSAETRPAVARLRHGPGCRRAVPCASVKGDDARTDRSCLLDSSSGHGLGPGVMRSRSPRRTPAPAGHVLIVGTRQTSGWSATSTTPCCRRRCHDRSSRWNTLVRAEGTRRPSPHGDVLPPAAGHPPRMPVIYLSRAPGTPPVAHAVPPTQRLSAGPDAAHRLGSHAHGLFPVRAGPQAVGARPVGPGAAARDVAARRRRRTERPQALHRVRGAPTRRGARHRDPPAQRRRAGALTRHPRRQRRPRPCPDAGHRGAGAPRSRRLCAGPAGRAHRRGRQHRPRGRRAGAGGLRMWGCERVPELPRCRPSSTSSQRGRPTWP